MGDLISRKALLERYGEPCHSFCDVIETMPAIDAERCGTERGRCAARRLRRTLRRYQAHIRRAACADMRNSAWTNLRRTARDAERGWTEVTDLWLR